MYLDAPRGFRDPQRVRERVAMLEVESAVSPLLDWAGELAARRNAVVPLFDPAQAGTDARVLLLLEAPGPMTNSGNKRPGSGFISPDNNDATAENVWRARDAVNLHTGVVAWNIVPWYLGQASKKPTAGELAQGGLELRRLLTLLPDLRAVVVSGRIAQDGWNKHVAPLIGSPYAVSRPGTHPRSRSRSPATASTFTARWSVPLSTHRRRRKARRP